MAIFTALHVAISLIGIVAGFVVINGFLHNAPGRRATQLFLAFTIATSVTGFGFPFQQVLPAHVIGVLSLVLLAVSLYGLYGRALGGGWRTTYVATTVIAQYFNVFVLVIQSFQKVPLLKPLAPTQSEPPFLVAQGLALIIFLLLGIAAALKFRPAGNVTTG